MTDPKFVGDAVREEIARLSRRETELLGECTRLVEERRAIDRRRMVEHFMRLANHARPERPTVPDDKTVRFRLRLVAQEFVELLAATVDTGVDLRDVGEAIRRVVDYAPIDVDMVDAIDALLDIDYVSESFKLALGANSHPLFAEVHRANLEKFRGERRVDPKDGKILKPPGWSPPDIEGELRKQGWTGKRRR